MEQIQYITDCRPAGDYENGNGAREG